MSVCVKILCAIAILCLSFVAGADGPYTWVDEAGIRHYGDTPPADLPYEEIGSANWLEAAAGAPAAERPEVGEGADIPGPETIGQCAHIEQRLKGYEEELLARATRSGDDPAIAGELELLESYRSNLRKHCHQ